MVSDPKEKLEASRIEETESESREVYLREGRTLSVSNHNGEDLVEIRSSSGMVEVRIRLTEQGPVMQMQSARLQLKATEAVEVEAPQFTVRTEESITLATKGDVKVEAEGEVDIDGEKIHLN